MPVAPFTVPSSEDWTPLPAVALVVPLGRSVSGQACRQPLLAVQVILPPFSVVSMYRVRPWLLTRTVPTPGTFFALTVADDEAPEALPPAAELAELPPAAELGLEPEPEAEVPPEEPHAASVTTAAPKIALPPSSRRADEEGWRRTVMLTGETPFEVSQSFKLFPLITGLGPGGIAARRAFPPERRERPLLCAEPQAAVRGAAGLADV